MQITKTQTEGKINVWFSLQTLHTLSSLVNKLKQIKKIKIKKKQPSDIYRNLQEKLIEIFLKRWTIDSCMSRAGRYYYKNRSIAYKLIASNYVQNQDKPKI